MMKIIAIAALLGGIVLLGVANEGAISWPPDSQSEVERGNCVEGC